MKNQKILYVGLVIVFVVGSLLLLLYSESQKSPTFELSTLSHKVYSKTVVFGAEIPTDIGLIANVTTYNPYLFPLQVKGGNFEFFVNNVSLGNGVINGPIIIESKTEGIITTEAKINSLPVIQVIIGLFETGEISVDIIGSVDVSIPLIGERKIPFNVKESLSLNL